METLPFVAALLGACLAVVRAWQVGRLALDAEVFVGFMDKILRQQRDLTKARKICAVVAETPLGAAAGAMISQRAFPRGTTPEEARAQLRDAFVQAFSDKASRIVAFRFLALLALVFCLGPVAHGLLTGAVALRVVVAGGIGVAILAWSARASHRILGSGPAVLERILDPAASLVLELPETYRTPDAAHVGGSPAHPTIAKDTVVIQVFRGEVKEGTLLFQQPIIKIGRDPRSHVSLDDETVSRMHAVMERNEDALVIIDLGNDPGTLVNGKKISKANLAHGDIIGIGSYELVVGLGMPARTSIPNADGAGAAGPAPLREAKKPLESETDDPRTWGDRAALIYGFDSRSPDLFYEIVERVKEGRRLRVAKLRRKEGTPRFVVAVIGGEDVLADLRARIEKEAPEHYKRFATSPEDIAPDALYGRETSTYVRIRADIAKGDWEVLTTRAG